MFATAGPTLRHSSAGNQPDVLTAAQESRFWGKVNKTEQCWLWTGGKQSKGYGQFSVAGRSTSVHRIAYRLAYGPIPPGLTIDHLCLVKVCVRPDHLEAVTAKVNNQRAHDNGQALPSPLSQRNSAKLFCVNGHPYSPDNTYVTPRGHRDCRTCKRAADERLRRRRKLP